MPVPILIYAVVSVLAGCGSSAFKPSNSESDVDVNDADSFVNQIDSSLYIAPDVDVVVTDVAPAVDLPKNIDSGMDAPVPKDVSQEIKAEVTETTDVPSTDISTPSNDACIPVTCTPDKIYYKGNVGRCISFSKSVLVADGPHLKVSVADVNGDLMPDIYILNNDQTHQLYINKNGNSFVESSALYSLNLKGPSYGALWGDMDQDSDLDLLLMNKAGTSLYVNDGGKYSLKITLGAEEAHAALWFNGGILLGTVNSLRFYQPSANWMYKEVAKEIGLFDGGDGHGWRRPTMTRMAIWMFSSPTKPERIACSKMMVACSNRLRKRPNLLFRDRYLLLKPRGLIRRKVPLQCCMWPTTVPAVNFTVVKVMEPM